MSPWLDFLITGAAELRRIAELNTPFLRHQILLHHNIPCKKQASKNDWINQCLLAQNKAATIFYLDSSGIMKRQQQQHVWLHNKVQSS